MQASKFLFHIVLYLALAGFTFLLLQRTLPYFNFEPYTAFLKMKTSYWDIDIWRISFYTHVFSSVLLLLAGFSQFSKKLLAKSPQTHRKLGYLYVVVLLGLSGPSGLVLSIYANGGPVSKVAFLLLTSIWLTSTIMALRTAKIKAFDKHKKWMRISYALTLSAVTLRAWRYLFANYWDDLGFELIRPMTLYQIVAWLGWIPNLALAIIINRLDKK